MLCVTQIFPLNTIEDDDIFLCELNGIDIDDYTIDSLSCRLFNPFQLNDKDYYTPLSQIDPDVNFYNNVNSHLGLNCNYYLENTFYELVKSQMHNSTTENVFSLCHLNIRSLRANLSAFELTLHNLRFHFTAIGISETWLNDHNCDLYDIAGYNLIEVHRHTKKVGGVGIFLDNNIPYQICSNLCLTDDVSECVFIEDELNSELSKISIWLRANKLSLNIGKTHFMLFSNKKRRHCDLNIKIDKTKIEEVKKTKFLGVIIDNKLTWKDHVAHVASKVSRGMGMIIKTRNYLNRKGLLTLYYTFVYPYLTYCNHIWGNIYQSNLKHLCVLQNKIVRIIAGVKPRESTGPLYDSLGIMKLTDLNKYLIARFMFRYCTNMVPKLFSSYFLRNYNVSSYDLRSANCFHLPLVATDLGKNGIRYRGPIVFNKLLIDGIDCTVSEAVFVNQLKRSIKTGKL